MRCFQPSALADIVPTVKPVVNMLEDEQDSSRPEFLQLLHQRPPALRDDANLEIVSNLRLEAPLVRCDPTAPWLFIEGGVQGVLVNDTLLVNGAIAPELSLPYLFLSGGTTGLEMNTKFAAVTGVGDPGGFCELAVINQAPTGVARLFLDS